MITKEIWEMSLEEYKRLKGYEIYWAFRDYSPSQWAGMNKRTRNLIEKQHKEEFAKNDKILKEHKIAVVHAIEEGKLVSEENKHRYSDVINNRQINRERYAKEVQESIIRYTNAINMKKSVFAKWWLEKELEENPQLKGFEYPIRSNANRYWKAVHEETKGVPRYVIESMYIDKHRYEETTIKKINRCKE